MKKIIMLAVLALTLAAGSVFAAASEFGADPAFPGVGAPITDVLISQTGDVYVYFDARPADASSWIFWLDPATPAYKEILTAILTAAQTKAEIKIGFDYDETHVDGLYYKIHYFQIVY